MECFTNLCVILSVLGRMQKEVTAPGAGEGTSFSLHQGLGEERENHGSVNVGTKCRW